VFRKEACDQEALSESVPFTTKQVQQVKAYNPLSHPFLFTPIKRDRNTLDIDSAM